MSDMIETPRMRIKAHLQPICEKYGVTTAQVFGPSRRAQVCSARGEIASYLKHEEHRSLAWIGNFLGGRNHGTVLWSLRRFEGGEKWEERAEQYRERAAKQKRSTLGQFKTV